MELNYYYERSDGYAVMRTMDGRRWAAEPPDGALLTVAGTYDRLRTWATAKRAMRAVDAEFHNSKEAA